jgi:hypothetical protein
MVTVQNDWYLYGCNVINYKALLIVMSESFGNPVQIHVMSLVNSFDIYRSHVLYLVTIEDRFLKIK